jgi:hypothetical protein
MQLYRLKLVELGLVLGCRCWFSVGLLGWLAAQPSNLCAQLGDLRVFLATSAFFFANASFGISNLLSFCATWFGAFGPWPPLPFLPCFPFIFGAAASSALVVTVPDFLPESSCDMLSPSVLAAESDVFADASATLPTIVCSWSSW